MGFGATCDAHHMTSAQSQGEGGVRAMIAAMKEACVDTGDIGYISAHGTGTPTNDRIESIAAHTLFAERAPHVPMSSIKSMLGHTMGAASAIEAIACALAVQTGWIPPTINYEEPDPECGLDIVPNVARKVDPRIALNNAYAFGGNNACLCVGRYE
jgi:3-oxoacyl-[acyl-carrier-protein] synthase II